MLKVHSTAPTASSLTITSARIRSQVPSAVHLPQPLMGGLPRPVALGKIPPRRTGAQLPPDRVDHLPVIPPPPAPATRCGQQRLDPRPGDIGQLSATHHRTSIRADPSTDPHPTPRPTLSGPRPPARAIRRTPDRRRFLTKLLVIAARAYAHGWPCRIGDHTIPA